MAEPDRSGRDRQDVFAQPPIEFSGKATSDMKHTAVPTTLRFEISQIEGAEHVKNQHGQQPERQDDGAPFVQTQGVLRELFVSGAKLGSSPARGGQGRVAFR